MIFEIIAASEVATEVTGNVATDLALRFGWKGWMFLAQCINFTIVIILLNKYAFGPIGKTLAERREKIAEGERMLVKIKEDLEASEKRTAEAIEEANKKSDQLIEEAKKSAELVVIQKTDEAAVSAEKIITKAKEEVKLDHNNMVKELKADFGKLVAAATVSVSGKILTDSDHQRINEESLAILEE